MKFFFDNCISPKLARAIHELAKPEHEVVALRDKFSADVTDTVWIPELAGEGDWVIVSGDLRIRTRPQERELWKAARLSTFFMAKNYVRLDAWEQVRWMVDKWPLIVDSAQRFAAGSAFEVPQRGAKLATV